MPRTLSLALLLTALSCALGARAETAVPGETGSAEGADDAVEALAEELAATVSIGTESEQEISIDAESSIDVLEEDVPRTWMIRSDVRIAATYSDIRPREGDRYDEEDVLGRARLGLSRPLGDFWRIGGRLAASCSSDSCRPDSFLDEGTQGSADSKIVVDETFLHWQHSERFDLVAGRMQTRFITKGGVFAKSMDRNDSSGGWSPTR